ncbi:MAG: STAS domain-containing protein [Thermonemataceae bacterium]
MKIDTQKESSFYIIAIDGDLDASSSIVLDTAIMEAIGRDEKAILFDCNALSYISSAGLGVFMSYLNEFEQQQIYSALYSLNPKVKNVFEILGLDQLIQIYADKQEAISRFNAAEL